MKKRLLNGEMIQLENEEVLLNLWFQPKTNNFCLMCNGVVIKSVKTWKPIENKLKSFKDLVEVEI